MNTQQMMEDYDRIARLCEAKDEEIARQSSGWQKANHSVLERSLQLSNSKAIVNKLEKELEEQQDKLKIQAEALKEYADETQWKYAKLGDPWRLMFNSGCRDGHGYEAAKNALSTTSETVPELVDNEIAQLRMEVAILRSSIENGKDEVIANYSVRAIPLEIALTVLTNTQATALAYEREVENRGAVKALEEFGNKAGFGSATLLRMIAELRAANKGETK